MSYYAFVVVVAAPDEGVAWNLLAETGPLTRVEEVPFIGEPWAVRPINEYPDNTPAGEPEPDDVPEFGTLEAFDQHPEK